MTTERTEAAHDNAEGKARTAQHAGTVSGRSPWHTTIRIGFGLALLIGVLVTVFAWPAAESQPRDVPIAVAGPPEAAAQIEQQLDAALPGGFAIEPANGADHARQLIEDRDVYGAIVLDPAGPPQVLTASAASPAIAQVLNGIAQQQAAAENAAPAALVEDIVPLPDDDPRGVGFSAAALPMVMGGLLVGAAMSIAISGTGRRVGGSLAAAVAAGPVAALVVHSWLGVLSGNYWANAAVITAMIAAISLTLVGLNTLMGRAGIGLGAAVMFLLGNPFSGVTSAPEMLPSGWGTLGQLLPPGAGGSLLRSTSFFDGAAAGGPVLVLGAWILAGLLLAAIGWAVRERVTGASTSQAAPAAR